MNAEQLGEWMDRGNWGTTELAAALGVHVRTVRRYLEEPPRGVTIPRPVELALQTLARRERPQRAGRRRRRGPRPLVL